MSCGVSPRPDEFHGDIELIADGDDHAALGGAVEFGEDDAGDADGLAEILRLRDGVLAGGGIEHQQHFVRRAVDALGDDVADFGQLAHQMVLRVQPAGGVDDQHIDPAALGGLAGVVRHGGGVGAHLVLDDFHAEPLGPDRELIDGGGAEGVAGADHHFLVHLIFQQPGELGDAGGFARAVDAGDEDDRRAGWRRIAARDPAARQPAIICSRTTSLGLVGISDFAQPPAVADLADDRLDIVHAHVGLENFSSISVEKCIVDLPAGDEERAHVGVEHLAVFRSAPLSLSRVLEKNPMGDDGRLDGRRNDRQ